MLEILSLEQVPEILFRLLREMDAESASESWYGGLKYPTRLREYAAHLKPNLLPHKCPSFRFEEAWTRVLAERLAHSGVSVNCLPRYPMGNEIGDLHLPILKDDKDLWLEMKGAWCYNRNYSITPWD